jgi:endonuclease/exonuclease/phosphatase family metal-dependent hydrolase
MHRWSRQVLLPLVLSPLLVLGLLHLGCKPSTPAATRAGEYLFCFWNVENLFDDRFDRRTGPGDKEYDGWLANHPEILKLKLDKLSEALIALNDGKGPDILAVVEVEGLRAAELLQHALNQRLSDPKLHYQNLLMKELSAGRHIAPAILTRLPVRRDKTRLHGSRQRILAGHITVDDRELVVLASHWTSRIQAGSDAARGKYADTLYGVFRAMHTNNPSVDLLICGDFNDAPHDLSVRDRLHATRDAEAVRKNPSPPILYNIMGDKDATKGFGTHYYQGWHLFDQIVVSPGLLDSVGWAVNPASAKTINTLTRPGDRLGRPWRFGGERDAAPRGYSDHFPVTVRLKMQ